MNIFSSFCFKAFSKKKVFGGPYIRTVEDRTIERKEYDLQKSMLAVGQIFVFYIFVTFCLRMYLHYIKERKKKEDIAKN